MSSRLSDILKVFSWSHPGQSARGDSSYPPSSNATQRTNLKPKVIKLNFRDIAEIDEIDPIFHEVNELSLNHNLLTSLSGIEQFKNIKILHLNFNRIDSWNELLKIRAPMHLQEISIKGNPNLELSSEQSHIQSMMSPRSPMSSKMAMNRFDLTTCKEVIWLLQVFPNLKRLNGQVVQSATEIMPEEAKSTMITDLGTNNFKQQRGSSEAMVNLHSERSGNGPLSEFALAPDRQINKHHGEITQVMYSVDSSNDHESVTSNYKKKRQQSFEEHKIINKKRKSDRQQHRDQPSQQEQCDLQMFTQIQNAQSQFGPQTTNSYQEWIEDRGEHRVPNHRHQLSNGQPPLPRAPKVPKPVEKTKQQANLWVSNQSRGSTQNISRSLSETSENQAVEEQKKDLEYERRKLILNNHRSDTPSSDRDRNAFHSQSRSTQNSQKDVKHKVTKSNQNANRQLYDQSTEAQLRESNHRMLVQLGYQDQEEHHQSRQTFSMDNHQSRRRNSSQKSIGSNRYQQLADDEDEGLDYDTLTKINKDTESSFDAYDARQYPKDKRALVSQQDNGNLQGLFDNSIQRFPVTTEMSQHNHSKQSSALHGNFHTFKEPSRHSRQESRSSNNGSVVATFKSFGCASKSKEETQVTMSEKKRMVARDVFQDNEEFCRQTLELDEQLEMIKTRKKLTILFQILQQWRSAVKQGLLNSEPRQTHSKNEKRLDKNATIDNQKFQTCEQTHTELLNKISKNESKTENRRNEAHNNNIKSFAKQFAEGQSCSLASDHHFASHAHTNSSSEMEVLKQRYKKQIEKQQKSIESSLLNTQIITESALTNEEGQTLSSRRSHEVSSPRYRRPGSPYRRKKRTSKGKRRSRLSASSQKSQSETNGSSSSCQKSGSSNTESQSSCSRSSGDSRSSYGSREEDSDLSEYQYSIQTSKYFTKKQLAKLKRIVNNFLIFRLKSKTQIYFQKWKGRKYTNSRGGAFKSTFPVKSRKRVTISSDYNSLDSNQDSQIEIHRLTKIRPDSIEIFDSHARQSAHSSKYGTRQEETSKKRVAFAVQSLSPTRKVVKNVLIQKNRQFLRQILAQWSLYAQSQQLKRLRAKEKRILRALKETQQTVAHVRSAQNDKREIKGFDNCEQGEECSCVEQIHGWCI